ncbi:hypothetical protein ABZ816_00235 [Actinosynnema sp. NPDC047251]|uniref:Uncharacterized protein n=1 Tax=Saccharothrix espanaensis (strain ATCC 51144 / DSM 44229 / JCM 9112 / NBRC 15066 / NRRL 15764) TaxID=1179773 RepID=K0JSK5_SACES|nr:hypothetical protein [Saccharothrix espanaensis]CCH30680.1 hypothetical protein BN6_33800 [Saccharothrix espanaensis DSM 44229]
MLDTGRTWILTIRVDRNPVQMVMKHYPPESRAEAVTLYRSRPGAEPRVRHQPAGQGEAESGQLVQAVADLGVLWNVVGGTGAATRASSKSWHTVDQLVEVAAVVEADRRQRRHARIMLAVEAFVRFEERAVVGGTRLPDSTSAAGNDRTAGDVTRFQ